MNSHSKRYHLLLLPQPQHRFNSLKASHLYFQTKPHTLSIRHSLDSRPSQNKDKSSLLDNVEDVTFGSKNWRSSKGCINKTCKGQ